MILLIVLIVAVSSKYLLGPITNQVVYNYNNWENNKSICEFSYYK